MCKCEYVFVCVLIALYSWMYVCRYLTCCLVTELQNIRTGDISLYLYIYISLYLSIYLSIYPHKHSQIRIFEGVSPEHLTSNDQMTPANAHRTGWLLGAGCRWKAGCPLKLEFQINKHVLSVKHIPTHGMGYTYTRKSLLCEPELPLELGVPCFYLWVWLPDSGPFLMV